VPGARPPGERIPRGERPKIDTPTLPPAPIRALDLAKVVDATNVNCKVRFLGDGSTADARWGDLLQRNHIVVRPDRLVLVAARQPGSGDPRPYEVVWRGPLVATVQAIQGDTYTYDSGYGAERVVAGPLAEGRPLDERLPIAPGQEIVVARIEPAPAPLTIEDVAADGLPLHPDRLRAAWLAPVCGAGHVAAPRSPMPPYPHDWDVPCPPR
jgi:hypothetical protein